MPLILEILLLFLQILLSYVEAFVKLFYNPKKDIGGRVAVLTGGAGGIGRHLAKELLQLNVKLAIWDINKDAVESLCDELREQGFSNVFAYQCDISKKPEVKRAAAETRRDLGEVDLLFNNAGILIGKDILDLSEHDIRSTIEINTVSHFWTVQEFLPSMLKKDYGHIINTASIAGKVGVAWLTDYCASKFAVVGMTDSLRLDILRRNPKSNIKVSAVCPFFVNTNLVTGTVGHCQPYCRFEKFMEPDFVARAIIDGVLRNEGTIYIPKKLFTSVLIGSLLPMRARLVMGDFIRAGFYPKDWKFD